MTGQSNVVLIVDDDQRIRELLSTALSHRGLASQTAADGKEAIAALGRNAYSVVLLDLVMPEVDGFRVVEWMHHNRSAMPVPPVLLIMSGAEPYDSELLSAQTVHGIIRKPFEAQELADLVAACAEVKSRGALGTMALAAFVSGAPLLALLDRFRP